MAKVNFPKRKEHILFGYNLLNNPAIAETLCLLIFAVVVIPISVIANRRQKRDEQQSNEDFKHGDTQILSLDEIWERENNTE